MLNEGNMQEISYFHDLTQWSVSVSSRVLDESALTTGTSEQLISISHCLTFAFELSTKFKSFDYTTTRSMSQFQCLPACSHIEESIRGLPGVAEVVHNDLQRRTCVRRQHLKYFSNNLTTFLYRGDLLAFDADVSFDIVLQSFQLGDHCSYI